MNLSGGSESSQNNTPPHPTAVNLQQALFLPSKDCPEYFSAFNEGTSFVKNAYEHLGILDSKASALLRFDGVILAALGIVIPKSDPSNVWTLTLFLVALVLIVASIVLCLLVVWVYWIKGTVSTSESNENNRNKIVKIVTYDNVERNKVVLIARNRTIRYRLAWISASLGFAIGVVAVVVLVCSLHPVWSVLVDKPSFPGISFAIIIIASVYVHHRVARSDSG